MKKYIVGGWNRDKIMGLNPSDKDYVLVGCTDADIARMRANGFEQVGKDFPVFLSPGGEEHALARVERKSGTGYNGFTVETDGVTLEQDLSRRDLTINAIAWDSVVQRYIDPFQGQQDIKNKVLKHVSSAFGEDPVRVLRLARFGAKFSDFKVHTDTLKLVKKMTSTGELKDLTPERVTLEFTKAANNNFGKFISYLDSFGALEVILPGTKYSKVLGETLKGIEENCTDAYRFDMMMTCLLRGREFTKEYQTGMLRLPGSTVRFIQKIVAIEPLVRSFRTLKAPDMVHLFNLIAASQNGGEEYVVKLLEYFVINKVIDIDLESLIFKVYDKYTTAKIPDLNAMIERGELESNAVRDYVKDIRINSINELFK